MWDESVKPVGTIYLLRAKLLFLLLEHFVYCVLSSFSLGLTAIDALQCSNAGLSIDL